MGLGGIGIWQLLIILVIVLLLFGTKRLKGLGGDLGSAIKGFKKAVSEEGKGAQQEEADAETKKVAADEAGETIDGVSTTPEDQTTKTESKS